MWDTIRDHTGAIKDHIGLWWITVAGSGLALMLREFRFIISAPYRAMKLEEDMRTLEESNDRLRTHNQELAQANEALRLELATTGIDAAGPDGAQEIEQWGSDAYQRLTAGSLSNESFWFLHGVRLAIHEHKQTTACDVRPCDACTCQESETR